MGLLSLCPPALSVTSQMAKGLGLGSVALSKPPVSAVFQVFRAFFVGFVASLTAGSTVALVASIGILAQQSGSPVGSALSGDGGDGWGPSLRDAAHLLRYLLDPSVPGTWAAGWT